MAEEKTAVRAVEAVYHGTGGVPYLIILSGAQEGRTMRLDKSPIVLGRSPRCHFIVDEDGISRQHAEFVADGEGGVAVRDSGSTHGTFVNGVRVSDRAVGLRDGDRVQVGSSVLLKYSTEDDLEEQFQVQQYRAAVGDGLTGLYNRKYLLDRLEQEAPFHLRHQRPLVLGLVAVQEFEAIVERMGVSTGDGLLRTLAAMLRPNVRVEDVLAVVDRAVFGVLLRETSLDEAKLSMNRLSNFIDEQIFTLAGEDRRVKLFWNATQLDPEQHSTGRDLLIAADRALYEAMKAGGTS